MQLQHNRSCKSANDAYCLSVGRFIAKQYSTEKKKKLSFFLHMYIDTDYILGYTNI